MRRLPALLVLFAIALFAACGGDDRPGERREEATDGCPGRIAFRTTYVPEGFDDEAKEGVGGGKDAVKGAAAIHYEGPEGRYIDIFRGGQRQKLEETGPARILGRSGRVGKFDGGLAARIRLGRGRCTRYAIEGYGVEEDEFVKFLQGLRQGATTG